MSMLGSIAPSLNRGGRLSIVLRDSIIGTRSGSSTCVMTDFESARNAFGLAVSLRDFLS